MTLAKGPLRLTLNKHALVALGILGMTAAGPGIAAEISVGDIFLCHTDDGLPSVEVAVGKLETLQDVFAGEEMEAEMAQTALVHLRMRSVSGPQIQEVGHSPFSRDVLGMCEATNNRDTGVVTRDFEDGYEIWKDAALKGEAGFFNVNPAAAYWSMLGVTSQ